MQEVMLRIHNIEKGDKPPKDGYYLLIVYTMADHLTHVSPMYWHSDVNAWTVTETDGKLFLPTNYYGYLWAEDTLSKVVKNL